MPNELQTGDIYLVRFHPSTGRELKKYRPAVIISATISKIDPRFCLVAPLTRTKSNNPWELSLKNTALEKDSTLLCWYLRTMDINRLEKKLGALSNQQIEEMRKTVSSLVKS
ncbi:MAG TPA: type II toxin-antitoxin system PemK/MazF family toxin [Patescibacteria group bacterium]